MLKNVLLAPSTLAFVSVVLMWIGIVNGWLEFAASMLLADLFFLGMCVGSFSCDVLHRIKVRRGGE